MESKKAEAYGEQRNDPRNETIHSLTSGTPPPSEISRRGWQCKQAVISPLCPKILTYFEVTCAPQLLQCGISVHLRPLPLAPLVTRHRNHPPILGTDDLL